MVPELFFLVEWSFSCLKGCKIDFFVHECLFLDRFMIDYQNVLVYVLKGKTVGFFFFSYFLFPIYFHLKKKLNQQNHHKASCKPEKWATFEWFFYFWFDFANGNWRKMVKMNVIQPKRGGQPSYRKFELYFLHGFCGFFRFLLVL